MENVSVLERKWMKTEDRIRVVSSVAGLNTDSVFQLMTERQM